MKKLLLTAIALVVLTGCQSNPDAAKYAHQTALAYYSQPNTANVLHVKTGEGGKASLSLEGDAELTLNTPVPTKNIIPRDPSVLKTAIEWAGRLGIGWMIGDALTAVAERPVLTSPEPVIVNQPAPVIVPAAGP